MNRPLETAAPQVRRASDIIDPINPHGSRVFRNQRQVRKSLQARHFGYILGGQSSNPGSSAFLIFCAVISNEIKGIKQFLVCQLWQTKV